MGTSINNRQRQVEIDAPKVKRTAQKILNALGCETHELSIVLVNDEEITRLNRQYFHRPRPTNVISFPMGPGESPGVNPQILGDVVISAETAQRQAATVGGKAEEEILCEGFRPMAFPPPSERDLPSGHEDLQYSDFGERNRMDFPPS
jgi:probable rRNA maturation factor